MLAIRTSILKELFRDHKWAKLMEEAETWEEVAQVLDEFCKDRGYKVKRHRRGTSARNLV